MTEQSQRVFELRLPGCRGAPKNLRSTPHHGDASQRALNQLITLNDTFEVAQVYVWRGENDHALDWLERAYTQGHSGLTWIKIYPNFRGLRSDARYMALLRKMDLAE